MSARPEATGAAAGDLLAAARWWECPCGTEPPKRPTDPVPVRTLVSIREPYCSCGRAYRPEYERGPGRKKPQPAVRPQRPKRREPIDGQLDLPEV